MVWRNIASLTAAALAWLVVEMICWVYLYDHEKTRIVTSTIASILIFYVVRYDHRHISAGWVVTMISMTIGFRYTRRLIMNEVDGMEGFLLGCLAANVVAAVIFFLGTFVGALD
ncbi:hypothetical protein E2C01_018593 [Portunus trituberculatus]|uniref:Uncharacterized protein n=1 Tax=Portunus trituberculatus TaxID=210409 RepID=A0A5B7DWV2_PORTR|nr:hypothetical protein [Portunus trituberculatus]